ncbi:MAG: hypothetical protein ACXQTR_03855 [Candidatus Methanospirareceae archaeon]
MFSIHDKKGQRILEYLKKELELPPNVIGFELHLRVDEIVTVSNLDYYPEDDKGDK